MMNPVFDLKVVQDREELAHAGARFFVDCARAVLKARVRFTVVLSGGKTPRPVYEYLATAKASRELPWSKIHFFWGDERNVASDHPESNFRMAWMAMLSHLPIPAENIHRIQTEVGSPQDAAEDYERMLRSFFGLRRESERPRFDLVFLGLGSDGHTASLFPDGHPGVSVSKEDPDRLVIAPWVRHLNDFRITLTPTALNESESVIFLVSGSEKASILASVLEGTKHDQIYPVQTIQPKNGRSTWLVDREATAALYYSS